MGRVLATALMATGVLLVSARPCWACSCAAQPPKAQADNADVIFTGRVIEAEDPFRFSGPRVQAVLAVELLYKGKAGSEIVVETYPGGSASCGLEFVEGERFTVFAFHNERGRLETTSARPPPPGASTRRGSASPAARRRREPMEIPPVRSVRLPDPNQRPSGCRWAPSSARPRSSGSASAW